MRVGSIHRVGLAFVLAGSCVAAAAAPARATGFSLPHQSAAAMGRASAAVAASRDADALYYNPAALSRASAMGAVVNLGVVSAATTFAPADGGPKVSSARQLRPVPSVFAHARVHDSVQVGLGLFAPFGYAVRWPEGWAGAQQSLQSRIVVGAANPNVAVRVWPWLSVAAGLSLLRGDLALGLALPEPAGGRADMTGNAWGVTWNAALLVSPLPDFDLALTFRAGTDLRFEGQADFEPRSPAFERTLPDQAGRATVPIPDVATAAVAWRTSWNLELTADVSFTRWSVFDELLIDLDSFDPLQRRQTRDAFAAALGIEASPTPLVRVRTGVRFEQSVSPRDDLSPSTPDAPRLALALGGGYAMGAWEIDVAYLYSHFFEVTADNSQVGPVGDYRTSLHAIAVSITGRRSSPRFSPR